MLATPRRTASGVTPPRVSARIGAECFVRWHCSRRWPCRVTEGTPDLRRLTWTVDQYLGMLLADDLRLDSHEADRDRRV
jgi:hypothetical protein